MKQNFKLCLVLFVAMLVQSNISFAQFPRFKVLAFYSKKVESAHVAFANDAIRFFKDLTVGNGFVFDTTTNMNDLNEQKLKDYTVIMMLNDFPHSKEQREAFQKYIEGGGGWLGFHVSAYNDKHTQWPWFVDFLGGGVFYTNNWPPLPAKIIVDDNTHPVTKGLPDTYIAPINEWYQWKPSPRENKNVKVLATLSTENFPLGLKDIIYEGDIPVVWTNTKYRMLYMNIGHGPKIFNEPAQDKMIIAGLRWLVATDKKGNKFGD